MKDAELAALCEQLSNEDQCDPKFDEIAKQIRNELESRKIIEMLEQLVNYGPIWDGNVISKSQRDTMLELGLACRVCVQGEQGYTAANYLGWSVLKL